MNSKRAGFQHLVQFSTLECVHVVYVVMSGDSLYALKFVSFRSVIRHFTCIAVSYLPSYTPVESPWRFSVRFWLFSGYLAFSLSSCREHIIVVKG